MPASRLIILGVAVAASGGAGYVAKNMVVAPSPRVVVDAPKQPGIALQDVLVLSGDVAMGSQLGNNINWEQWPASGVNANFITRAAEPDAVEKLKGSVARFTRHYESARFGDCAQDASRLPELFDEITASARR